MEEPQEENKIIPKPTPGDNKLVQTYAEDMAEVIEDNKGGIVKKLIQEEEAKALEKMNLSPEAQKNKIFIVLGAVLFLVALGVFSFLFITNKVGTTDVAPQLTPMIFIDKAVSVEVALLTPEKIAQSVLNEAINTDVKYGGVEGLYLSSGGKAVGLREFIRLIKGNLVLGSPELVDGNFLLGVYSWETRSVFMLVKIRSLPDIFNSMRAWEAKMFNDLHGFFNMTVSSDTSYLLTKSFEDGVIENKNARILYDVYGSTALMYVFVDDEHLLIANDIEAVREIIVRLAASRIKR